MPPLELRRLWYLDGRKMALWSEPSRRRLKRETQAISQSLAPHIPRSCTHVRGHGGVKGALRQIQRRMPKARFVARFDIAAYYTSMRHDVIEAQVAATALDAHHRKLIADYLALPDMRNTGVGMVASGGLSPLLGALYLTPLDRRMDRLCKGKRLVHYVHYMDDIVMLPRPRWEFLRDIAALHEEILTLGLHPHRITRFIAREGRSYVLSVASLMRREDIPDSIPRADELRAALPEMSGNGGSCIAAPDATWVIEPVIDREELLVAELDAAFVRRERHNFDISGHYARPEILHLELDSARHRGLWKK